jgi:hypothetical protein
MKEAFGKNTKEEKLSENVELSKRLEAKVNLQRALDAMARLRRTIDRRPGRLFDLGKNVTSLKTN